MQPPPPPPPPSAAVRRSPATTPNAAVHYPRDPNLEQLETPEYRPAPAGSASDPLSITIEVNRTGDAHSSVVFDKSGKDTTEIKTSHLDAKLTRKLFADIDDAVAHPRLPGPVSAVAVGPREGGFCSVEYGSTILFPDADGTRQEVACQDDAYAIIDYLKLIK